MGNPFEKFNAGQTEKLNNLLAEMPELDKTEDLDTRRIEWLSKMADLLSETKTSLEELRTSEKLDLQRIKWWMKQSGIEVHDEHKQ